MSFLAMDPPQHGRMRGLVSRGFTPRRVAGMEDGIRALTVQHLDDCLDKGDFDFVADLAGKVPMDVISEMLGVPQADRAMLRRQSDLLIHREEGVTDVPPAGVEAAFALVIYYADLIADRRANPGDDLVSALCAAEVDGDRLTDDEITSFLFLMVVAGNETTTKLLAHAWYWGDRNPDERAKAFTDADAHPRLGRGDAALRHVEPDARPGHHHRPHLLRPDDPEGRPGAAARRLGQPRRAGLRRPGPLRPRPGPGVGRHRQLRRGPPLLHGRIARPARGPHRAGGAHQAGRRPTRSTRPAPAASTPSTSAASSRCPPP